MSTRDDTPWYPTMRIRRLHRGQSWQDAVAALVLEIEPES